MIKYNTALKSSVIALVLCLGAHTCTYAQASQNANKEALEAFIDKLTDKISDTSTTSINAATNVASTVLDTAQNIVFQALDLIGVRYRFGGNTPETGLDCSGFVKLVFERSIGLVLPRNTTGLSTAGREITVDELQAGDLVFYNTLRRPFSHVGIYLGNGKFVHAPSTGGYVRTEVMDTHYWKQRFNGARRVAPE